jgi:hypothetical protein
LVATRITEGYANLTVSPSRRALRSIVSPTTHQATIADQFSRQAEQFAAAPALHNQAALDLPLEQRAIVGGRKRQRDQGVALDRYLIEV